MTGEAVRGAGGGGDGVEGVHDGACAAHRLDGATAVGFTTAERDRAGAEWAADDVGIAGRAGEVGVRTDLQARGLDRGAAGVGVDAEAVGISGDGNGAAGGGHRRCGAVGHRAAAGDGSGEHELAAAEGRVVDAGRSQGER